MKIDPMRQQQYEDGQAVPSNGVWEGGDPHVNYADFYDWAEAYHARMKRKITMCEYVRRKQAFDKLCTEFPLYWQRYKNGGKPTLGELE